MMRRRCARGLGTVLRGLIFNAAAAAVACGATTTSASAQCPDGTPPPCAAQRRPAPAPNSVAVLYFDNLSRDTSDVFLADGLTEELIIRLSQVRRLEVKSRFESLRFRGQRVNDPRAIGRELHASFLVTGSIQQAGQRVRLRVALVRTRDGTQQWGDVYERAGGDILTLQADVAREVAGAITGQLLPEERASLARRPTRDPIAYNLYLRGIGAANTISEAGLRAGLEYFDRAIARDSTFANAYAQKALIWVSLADGYVEGRVGYAQAREAADQALRRDSSLALAYAMLGQAALALDADAPLAIRLAEHALGLDARSAWGHITLSNGLFVSEGADDSAVAEARRAWEADTLSAVPAVIYLMMLAWSHPADSLRPVMQRMRGVLSPADERVFDGAARLALGDTAGAVRQLSWEYYGGLFACEYVRALSALGRRNAALVALDSMRQAAQRAYVNPYAVARSFAMLGNADSAFAWLDRAWVQRTMFLLWLRTDPEFVPYRADPRWAAFLRKMGLTP
ncbi:MAG: hypothetical protein ABSG61_09815 [Gemmatimonadales bacterium]